MKQLELQTQKRCLVGRDKVGGQDVRGGGGTTTGNVYCSPFMSWSRTYTTYLVVACLEFVKNKSKQNKP